MKTILLLCLLLAPAARAETATGGHLYFGLAIQLMCMAAAHCPARASRGRGCGTSGNG